MQTVAARPRIRNNGKRYPIGAMSSLLAWRKVPIASGESLPFRTRWHTAIVEV